MTSLSEYAESIRAKYLEFYRQQLADLKAAKEACESELLVKPNGAANPEPYCLIRLDAVYTEGGEFKVVRVAMDQPAAAASSSAGEWTAFDVDGLRVSVPGASNANALSWEAVTLSFHSAGFDLRVLQAWLSQWIDETEIRSPDETGLDGVVHSIAWNQTADHGWEITIDFGSAPVEALLELLQILASEVGGGVREVVLETRSEG